MLRLGGEGGTVAANQTLLEYTYAHAVRVIVLLLLYCSTNGLGGFPSLSSATAQVNDLVKASEASFRKAHRGEFFLADKCNLQEYCDVCFRRGMAKDSF